MTQLTDRLRDLALTSKHLCQSPDCTEPQCIAEQVANELESLRAERDTAEANLLRLQDRWDARPATEELEARLAEAERHLALVLPMAKGYASAHRVGANAEIVEDAAEFLRATDSAALQCTGCVGVTKPICGHFAEQDDGEGRVSHYCATCGHSNECHEPASTAHSASCERCNGTGQELKHGMLWVDCPECRPETVSPVEKP